MVIPNWKGKPASLHDLAPSKALSKALTFSPHFLPETDHAFEIQHHRWISAPFNARRFQLFSYICIN